MKDLRFIDIWILAECNGSSINWKFDKVSPYLPSSLRTMRWQRFPFSSLPDTFQGENLVELDMEESNIVQLWEDGERKTFDLRVAPNLERLTIYKCYDFVELHMPAESLKLVYVSLSHSKLKTLHLGSTPNLETLILEDCNDLVELKIPDDSLKLQYLDLNHSKLKTLHLGSTPNLEMLILKGCNDLLELQMPAESPKLLYLELSHSKLTNLHLGNTPNLERLVLQSCNDLVEFQMPTESLKLQELYLDHSKLRTFDISLTPNLKWFKSFVFDKWSQPAEAGSLSNVCPLHCDNDSLKFQFLCFYKEDPASSFGNLERLISLGLCACTNLESFSRSICSLQCIKKLTLEGSITEAPRDLDQLECLEELTFSSTEIKHLPDSICKLKHLKSFKIKSCWLLEKLPKDIGRLESLETLILSDGSLLQDIPNNICKMKCINSFDLHGCIRVVELPEDIGCLEGLKELNIGGTGITRLPHSIFHLRGLRIVGSMRLIDTYGLVLKRRRTSDDDEIVWSNQQEAFVNQCITVSQVNSDRLIGSGEQEANATQLRW
ncbi:leucine-rich repeat domain, L domain-like protein [Artemisia annua]|uniref:Leucine-rich repeat domain, L domain-like protein n=1 Tax=Artemisia annua TaxID=35608 RepID=A0A2U1N0E6_ARTAN|nr:leucine-rich repeat domain, L domain-like protein [Artemisia annua]